MSICFLIFLDLLPKYFNRTHFAKEWRRRFQTWKLDVPILCAYIEWKREGNINYQKAWIVDIINTCLFLFMFDKRCQRSLTQDVIATWSWWWKAQERQQDSGYAGHWLPRNDSGPYPAGWISDCPGPGDGQSNGVRHRDGNGRRKNTCRWIAMRCWKWSDESAGKTMRIK